jgi:hypothetical protein
MATQNDLCILLFVILVEMTVEEVGDTWYANGRQV